MRISFFVVLCLLSPLSLASDWLLSLEGERTQGALLRGQVAPEVTVKLGDRAVRTTPEGFFAVGFGRDDALEQVLVLERQGEAQQVPVTLANGNTTSSELRACPSVPWSRRRKRC